MVTIRPLVFKSNLHTPSRPQPAIRPDGTQLPVQKAAPLHPASHSRVSPPKALISAMRLDANTLRNYFDNLNVFSVLHFEARNIRDFFAPLHSPLLRHQNVGDFMVAHFGDMWIADAGMSEVHWRPSMQPADMGDAALLIEKRNEAAAYIQLYKILKCITEGGQRTQFYNTDLETLRSIPLETLPLNLQEAIRLIPDTLPDKRMARMISEHPELTVRDILTQLSPQNQTVAAIYLPVKPTEANGKGTVENLLPAIDHSLEQAMAVRSNNGLSRIIFAVKDVPFQWLPLLPQEMNPLEMRDIRDVGKFSIESVPEAMRDQVQLIIHIRHVEHRLALTLEALNSFLQQPHDRLAIDYYEFEYIQNLQPLMEALDKHNIKPALPALYRIYELLPSPEILTHKKREEANSLAHPNLEEWLIAMTEGVESVHRQRQEQRTADLPQALANANKAFQDNLTGFVFVTDGTADNTKTIGDPNDFRIIPSLYKSPQELGHEGPLEKIQRFTYYTLTRLLESLSPSERELSSDRFHRYTHDLSLLARTFDELPSDWQQQLIDVRLIIDSLPSPTDLILRYSDWRTALIDANTVGDFLHQGEQISQPSTIEKIAFHMGISTLWKSLWNSGR